jgi:hypothetical protein
METRRKEQTLYPYFGLWTWEIEIDYLFDNNIIYNDMEENSRKTVINFKAPINAKTGQHRYIPEARTMTKTSFDECFSGIPTSYIEYFKFPAITSFIDKYKKYPSVINYSDTFKYEDFINKIDSIKKTFYVDSFCEQGIEKNYRATGNTYYLRNFIFFIHENGLLFYIESDMSKDSTLNEYLPEYVDCKIVCLLDHNLHSFATIGFLQKEIFDLESKVFKKNNTGILNIIVETKDGYELNEMQVTCPDIDFSINYNHDFEPIHKLIVEKLSTEKSKGLILLHGVAGSGKTNYIRYLINNLKKKVIYIPPGMADSISDPVLIKFFMSHPNSVLVIEDAENVLMKRNANSSQAISNILNLTDGLLSDCANIQIVATFNTDILNIDEALLRKGRLIAKYEFKSLSEDRVIKLSKKLGVKVNGENTLANIYGAENMSFEKEKSKIGF